MALLVGVVSLVGLAIAFLIWRHNQPQLQITAEQGILRWSEDAETELSADSEINDLILTFAIPQAQSEAMATTSISNPIQPNFVNPPVIQKPRVVETRKQQLVTTGSGGIQQCVDDALSWLCEHQQADGGWGFDLFGGTCANRCDHPGTLKNSRNDATGLALLAFLGAGHTHIEGSHKQQIDAGLNFLVASLEGKTDPDIASASGGFSSGTLGTLALCESYAMTRDEGFKSHALEAIQRLSRAARPASGTNQPSDHRNDAWLLMAIKSGQAADLPVPAQTWHAQRDVFDTPPIEIANGKTELFDPNGSGSQIAAHCFARLLLAYDRDEPTLQQGVARIAATGLVKTDLEYVFFATQSLHHWRKLSPDENRKWIAWHRALQNWLQGNQETQGHRKGSWFINDRRADDGGRLFCTAMAVMILEVYYRHLPIYGDRAIESFPSRPE